MLLIIFAVCLMVFGFLYFHESGLFKLKRIKTFEAVVVDESEDELYDNIGGTKTRFYKVYEYFDGEENRIVKSERPMRRINNDVGRKCVIYVDSKNRRAMEKKDVIAYRIFGAVLFIVAIFVIACCIYLKLNVPGAAII